MYDLEKHHLRILHISDLHAEADVDWEPELVLGGAWDEVLDQLTADGRAIDLVCLTGDLAKTGQLDEALRIRQEEELPVYDRLGDVRGLLVGRANLALGLIKRNQAWDREEAISLLQAALADAQRLNLPEEGQITDILRRIGA
jgi:3',5'-cyclic AMP phosphodiesterase CpdA